MKTPKWTMKSGEKIRVRDMSDSHLLNTVKMLRRQSAAELQEHLALAASAMSSLSGEMASYYAEQDFDRACESDPDDYLPEIYFDMEEELRQRKIEIPE